MSFSSSSLSAASCGTSTMLEEVFANFLRGHLADELRAGLGQHLAAFLSQLSLHRSEIMIELDNLRAAVKATHDATAAANGKIDSLLSLLSDVKNQLAALTVSGGASASELKDLTDQVNVTVNDINAEAAKVDAALMPLATPPAPAPDQTATDPVAQGAAAVAEAQAAVAASDASAATGTVS